LFHCLEFRKQYGTLQIPGWKSPRNFDASEPPLQLDYRLLSKQYIMVEILLPKLRGVIREVSADVGEIIVVAADPSCRSLTFFCDSLYSNNLPTEFKGIKVVYKTRRMLPQLLQGVAEKLDKITASALLCFTADFY
jgi:hypothetical protein